MVAENRSTFSSIILLIIQKQKMYCYNASRLSVITIHYYYCVMHIGLNFVLNAFQTILQPPLVEK